MLLPSGDGNVRAVELVVSADERARPRSVSHAGVLCAAVREKSEER